MASSSSNRSAWPSCSSSPPQVVPLTILYGTQTFTALEIATLLARRAARRGFRPRLEAMDDFPRAELIDQSLVVFVASTTGDGEVPETMFSFWRFLLRRSLPAGILGPMRFTVFGLGDSSYPKFNAVARRLDVRLKQLGATSFHEMGYGDDQSEFGVYGDFDRWVDGLWTKLLSLHPFDTSKYAIDDSPLLGSPVSINFLPREVDSKAQQREESQSCAPTPAPKLSSCKFYHSAPTFAKSATGKPIVATLASNTRIAADNWSQDVRHLRFTFDPADGGFEAGDVVVLYPQNGWWNSSLPSISPSSTQRGDSQQPSGRTAHSGGGGGGGGGDALPEKVQRTSNSEAVPSDAAETPAPTSEEDPFIETVCQRLGVEPCARFTAAEGADWMPPEGCSVRDLLTHFLDVNGTPTRVFFEQLSFFASDTEQADKLLELASAEGTDLFHSYITRERRSYAEVLCEFDSVSVPLGHFIALVPRLKPRYFSIASAAAGRPGTFELSVAVVAYKTPWRRQRHGVCSNWLAHAAAGEGGGGESPLTIPVWFKKGSLRLPPDVARDDVLLVGPGTGVAPMRALIQRRAWLLNPRRPSEQQTSPCASVAEMQQREDAVSTGRRRQGQGRCFLFFGCRRSDKDYYYRAEWEHHAANGTLDGVFCAFSREKQRLKPPNTTTGEVQGLVAQPADVPSEEEVARTSGYVQRRLRENATLVWDALRPEAAGVLCLAGSAKGMPKDVKAALVEIFVETGGLANEAEAVKYLRELERLRRFQCEAWA